MAKDGKISDDPWQKGWQWRLPSATIAISGSPTTEATWSFWRCLYEDITSLPTGRKPDRCGCAALNWELWERGTEAQSHTSLAIRFCFWACVSTTSDGWTRWPAHCPVPGSAEWPGGITDDVIKYPLNWSNSGDSCSWFLGVSSQHRLRCDGGQGRLTNKNARRGKKIM